MKISIVYLTYRPGGYDILVDSLRNQTFQDYELIVVDEMVERRDTVKDYLLENAINVSSIGPSKPKCFPELAYNLINAYNTGILLSRGDYVMILNDYAWLPPRALESWMHYEVLLKAGIPLTGTACLYKYRKPRKMEGELSVFDTFWQGHPAMKGLIAYQIWTPEVFELFYSMIPYETLVKINSFPECFDYSPANQVTPFIDKVKSEGLTLGCVAEVRCHMIDHRGWGEGESAGLWHLGKLESGGSKKLILRENTFNLRAHKRGTLP